MNDDDVRISYTARELLERMDKKLDDVKGEVTGLGSRVAVLERAKEGSKRFRTESREALVALATVVMACGTAISIGHFLHW